MKLLNYYKNIFYKFKYLSKEEIYYKNLFVKNRYWNTAEANSEEILRWKIIKEFIESIKDINDNKEIEILDLGCGRGWLTNKLSYYGKVLGIDPMKSVINHAKNMFPSICFICGTSKTIIDNGSIGKYDLIVSSEVIEHITDTKKELFIEDIYKLLKVNGYFIITTPRKEIEEAWNYYVKNNQPIEEWISEKDLERMIVKKKFKKCKLKRIGLVPRGGFSKMDIYQLWLFKKFK